MTPVRAAALIVLLVAAPGLAGCVTTVVGATVGTAALAVKTTGKVAVGAVKTTGKVAGAVIPDKDEDEGGDD